jgi:hypothetical protein
MLLIARSRLWSLHFCELKKRSHECERGTHECVRYKSASLAAFAVLQWMVTVSAVWRA